MIRIFQLHDTLYLSAIRDQYEKQVADMSNNSIFPWGKGMNHYSAAEQHQVPFFDGLSGSAKVPSLYEVVLSHNGDVPVDFMAQLLERFFHHSYETAKNTLSYIKDAGSAVCGAYTLEVAETKIAEIEDFSRRHHHQSLKCTIQENQEYVVKKS